jgi:hypothetical protein
LKLEPPDSDPQQGETNMIPYRLEHVIEQLLHSNPLNSGHEQRIIKDLTGVRVARQNARTVWDSILEHKWYMSEHLNRDVGMRTAAVDYLDNIAPRLSTSQSRIPSGLRRSFALVVKRYGS